jgi:hypothetical protein
VCGTSCDWRHKFSIHIENSITPIGQIGQIDAAHHNRIDRIDGLDAIRFIERETGKARVTQ